MSRTTEWPMVSVVVPARDEARSLPGCLETILAQDYPADRLEVLVVDGGSRDGSRAIASGYARRDPRLRVLGNPAGTIPAGLNVGIRASRGDVLARVDARTRLAPDYLATGVRLLQETGASNVGGPVRSVSPGYRARVLALALESRFGMSGAAVRYGAGAHREVDTVYLGMYPRRVLDAIGLYDEELVRDQDDELNYRLRARGGRVLLSPALRTSYLNSASLSRFVRQNFLYGYWKVRVWQEHAGMTSWRHFVPPLFVLGLLAGPVLARRVPAARLVWRASLAAYGLGALGAAGAAGRRAGWRYAGGLPVVFGLLHVSWGLGFLAGLVRLGPRRLARGRSGPVAAAGAGKAVA